MRKIFLLLSLVAAGGLQAQVQIQTTLPTTGLIQRNQLWDIVMLNNSNATINGRLEMVLTDRQTSQELLTATTGEFTITRGAQAVNVNKLNPVQYNYLGMEPDRRINDLLKAGAYTVCYTFVKNPDSEKRVPLAEECVAFDVEPLSPPSLTFPADSAVLTSSPSQFSWLPPVPAAVLNGLHYTILIAEIQPSQQPAEAIQENAPFFSDDIITGNFMTYPAALPAFEKDKWYAWQVIAMDDKNYAGKSEVWVFKVKQESAIEKIINGTPFIRMKADAQETGIAPQGVLKLSYFNRSADPSAQLILYNMSSGDGRPQATLNLELIAGENQLQINLRKLISLSEENTYRAEIISSRGEKNSILFRVKYFEAK